MSDERCLKCNAVMEFASEPSGRVYWCSTAPRPFGECEGFPADWRGWFFSAETEGRIKDDEIAELKKRLAASTSTAHRRGWDERGKADARAMDTIAGNGCLLGCEIRRVPYEAPE